MGVLQFNTEMFHVKHANVYRNEYAFYVEIYIKIFHIKYVKIFYGSNRIFYIVMYYINVSRETSQTFIGWKVLIYKIIQK